MLSRKHATLKVSYLDEYKMRQMPGHEKHDAFGRAVGVQLVEMEDAVGCMFNPSAAAMLANYWCSLARRGSWLWSEEAFKARAWPLNSVRLLLW
jgi:hypothetical protein